MSDKEVERLWLEYVATRGVETRNRLVEYYLPIVRILAHAVKRRGVPIDVDELISAGQLGLIDAVERFEPERGHQFETFARPKIQYAILDELRLLDVLPRGLRKSLKRVGEAIDKFRMRGRSINVVELAVDLGVEEREALRLWHQWEASRFRYVELDRVTRADDSPEAQLLFEGFVAELLQGFTGQQQQAVRLYAIDDLTMKKIGQILGCCESRVSQLISQARPIIAERIKRMRAA